MINFNYIKKIKIPYCNLLIAIPICLIILLSKKNFIISESNDIVYALINIWGNINLNSQDFLEYILYIINYAITIYLFGTCISDEFNKNFIYFFTRGSKISKWLLIKIKEIFISINFFFIIQIITILFLCKINNFIIYDIKKTLILLSYIYINLITQTMILALISNILSLKFGNLIGYLFTFVSFSFCILLSYVFKLFQINSYLIYVPFISSITGWYDSLNWILNRQLYTTTFYIPDYNFHVNLFLNIMILLILVLIIYKYIQKKELI